ncbi:dihydroorotate dehydrogenase [Chitinispirillum alkaliphilum]|nr:dihydroorotate dehydrogenase [Chitinispirillum alkaliphilum]
MNTRTTYMGIELKNPLIVGASSLTASEDHLKQIEDSGASAVVLKSLFQEQLELENYEFEEARDKYSEGVGQEIHAFYPHILQYHGIDSHLLFARKTKESLSIPVIASISAKQGETMLEYARQLEQTGVDGLELNIYHSPDYSSESGQSIEEQQLTGVREVIETTNIPISVKITPYYTNILHTLQQFDKTGIQGIVLFNRPFQAGIDINSQSLDLSPFLSTPQDSRLPIHFTGQLYSTLNCKICASTGIFDHYQGISAILAGADCFQVCSTLYKNGTGHIQTILRNLRNWMEEKGYSSIDDFRGKLSRAEVKGDDPWAYKRTQYVDILWRANQMIDQL